MRYTRDTLNMCIFLIVCIDLKEDAFYRWVYLFKWRPRCLQRPSDVTLPGAVLSDFEGVWESKTHVLSVGKGSARNSRNDTWF